MRAEPESKRLKPERNEIQLREPIDNKSPNYSHLTSLPNDILLLLFNFFDNSTLLSLRRTSKKFKQIVKTIFKHRGDDVINYYEQHFGDALYTNEARISLNTIARHVLTIIGRTLFMQYPRDIFNIQLPWLQMLRGMPIVTYYQMIADQIGHFTLEEVVEEIMRTLEEIAENTDDYRSASINQADESTLMEIKNSEITRLLHRSNKYSAYQVTIFHSLIALCDVTLIAPLIQKFPLKASITPFHLFYHDRELPYEKIQILGGNNVSFQCIATNQTLASRVNPPSEPLIPVRVLYPHIFYPYCHHASQYLTYVAQAVIALVLQTRAIDGDDTVFELPWGVQMEYANLCDYRDYFLRLIQHCRPEDIVDEIIRLWKIDYQHIRDQTELNDVVTRYLKQQGFLHQTLLHLFALTGNTGAIVKLVEAGVNINAVDGWHRTPLFSLFIGNAAPSVTLLEFLHSQGADFNVMNDQDENLYETYESTVRESYHHQFSAQAIIYHYQDKSLSPYDVAFTFLLAKQYVNQLPDVFIASADCVEALSFLRHEAYITENAYVSTAIECLKGIRRTAQEPFYHDEVVNITSALKTSLDFLYSQQKITSSVYEKLKMECTALAPHSITHDEAPVITDAPSATLG